MGVELLQREKVALAPHAVLPGPHETFAAGRWPLPECPQALHRQAKAVPPGCTAVAFTPLSSDKAGAVGAEEELIQLAGVEPRCLLERLGARQSKIQDRVPVPSEDEGQRGDVLFG